MISVFLAGALAATPVPAHDAFFARLSALCGQSFEGRLATPPTAGDAAFQQRLVVEVRDCRADEVRMPLAAGADRSRTWIVTRTPDGLRLKHDHRHADGTEDVLTQYGGDTTGPGSAERQAFPADAFSKALFLRENAAVSVPNVWALEIRPGQEMVYELSRPGRLFRISFDLARPLSGEAP
ncbi:hypothetical protein [Phenylobacterium sp.]|uniref:hypothetical protein n=1 Tax=Phenylobacterium sp. TaxID=1871053 RepID=UPI00301C659A